MYASDRRRQADLAGLRSKISSSPSALFARGGGWTAAKKCNKYLIKNRASISRARANGTTSRIAALDRACRGKCKVLAGVGGAQGRSRKVARRRCTRGRGRIAGRGSGDLGAKQRMNAIVKKHGQRRWEWVGWNVPAYVRGNRTKDMQADSEYRVDSDACR